MATSLTGGDINIKGRVSCDSLDHQSRPAKRRRSSQQSDLIGQNGFIGKPLEPNLFDCQQKSTMDDCVDGSQSTGRMSRELDADTSHNTPNESVTSASIISHFPFKKSVSPSIFLRADLESSSPSILKPTPSTPDTEKCKPRSSIPARLPAPVYAQQCISAAFASRLNPYALHKNEQMALQDHLCHLHVTVYLNIRNGILRLWTRNPMVRVTREEAFGCAKDQRWVNLAAFAYEWLVRNGYINFGCVDVPDALVLNNRRRRKDGPVVVIIGAGMSGLGCARQLEYLFRQYRDNAASARVIVIEGRRRIGGRIYSHPLKSHQATGFAPEFRPTAEMGAQIVVGFERGNPLDVIIRGQLALRCHLLRDISTIYDIDGSPVDELRDAMDERLYNDVLDRSGLYRHQAVMSPTAEGDRELINSGRDWSLDDGVSVRQYEEARAAGTIGLLLPAKRIRRGVGHKTSDLVSAGAPLSDLRSAEDRPAALECQSMGWKLRDGVSVNNTLNLDLVGRASDSQTLGAVMDEGVRQYQRMLPLTSKDMRLLNWHFANLEYANAANVGKLSLSGWDQDMGNEFEGEHAQVIGGYQQVPRGLWCFPTKLDVRTNKAVTKVVYDIAGTSGRKAMVHCEDGETISADKVIFTGSLGVLRHGSVQFQPPLPDWKIAAIDRLGFGIMNKVVLVFDEPFWDVDRDMFGLLREPKDAGSMDQDHYSANRGRFYLFWNCVKTSGLPVLIALLAGDAAHQAEHQTDAEIIGEVTSQLRNIFKNATVPDPLETIITRWGLDKFTRGSYSFVASEALPGDYDLMAKSIGNLYFAGEATCGTHPATVHGAYLSGLRAASEVIESILGPIHVPTPLVPAKSKQTEPGTPVEQKRNEPSSVPGKIQARSNNSFPSESTLREAYEQAMWTALYAELGPPEPRPAKIGLNPFLLYQKDFWYKAKERSDDARRATSKNPNAKATRDEIRHTLGRMWRDASELEKRPYLEQIAVNRQTNSELWDRWKENISEWEKKTYEFKDRWCEANPFEIWQPGNSIKIAFVSQTATRPSSRTISALSQPNADVDDNDSVGGTTVNYPDPATKAL
ncbi:Flavin containing amine oxidoreductase domain containing protein [Elaphomyces granulatus]